MTAKAPIIVVKKKGGHGGHHGGAWKVAYADFVTAMMALFIVLWLMNSSQKIQKAVGGYFKDPTGKSEAIGSDMQGTKENFVVSKDNMEQLKEQLQAAMKKVPDFDKLKNHIDMTVTNEGLRIELTESASGTFFNQGSSKFNVDGQDLLFALAAELGKLPNQLYVEGHTDAKPYSNGSGYSNWELSADRANDARRLLQSHGVREDQVQEVRGFADMLPRNRQNPLDPSNRRISLIVKYLDQAAGDKGPADGKASAAGSGAALSEVASASGSGSASPAAKENKK
ncbi:MAG TPA: flagellar motor protein MotB [Candidatus Acidoferrales bacterium]|jgi:chemotaxis protein MotB|nr:flagellar motor protein MotB [Candidatus Acidoferrales bacterium]